jgi:hypothetical protein
MYTQAVAEMPQPVDTIYLDPIVGPTRLYDRNGQTLLFSVQDPLGDQRAWIPLDSLPPYVIDATLLMEDPGFLTRPRPGLLSAPIKLWQNALSGPLPMDRKPSKFEVLEKITHGCRVPLARVREATRDGGRIFAEVAAELDRE